MNVSIKLPLEMRRLDDSQSDKNGAYCVKSAAHAIVFNKTFWHNTTETTKKSKIEGQIETVPSEFDANLFDWDIF